MPFQDVFDFNNRGSVHFSFPAVQDKLLRVHSKFFHCGHSQLKLTVKFKKKKSDCYHRNTEMSVKDLGCSAMF